MMQTEGIFRLCDNLLERQLLVLNCTLLLHGYVKQFTFACVRAKRKNKVPQTLLHSPFGPTHILVCLSGSIDWERGEGRRG